MSSSGTVKFGGALLVCLAKKTAGFSEVQSLRYSFWRVLLQITSNFSLYIILWHLCSFRIHSDVPFSSWSAEMVASWLEDEGLTQYVDVCVSSIQTGDDLIKMSSSDLEKVFGMKKILHRKKLHLALQVREWCRKIVRLTLRNNLKRFLTVFIEMYQMARASNFRIKIMEKQKD